MFTATSGAAFAPAWSPDDSRITFTRKHEGNNFDIFTIRPDGTDKPQLTDSPWEDGMPRVVSKPARP